MGGERGVVTGGVGVACMEVVELQGTGMAGRGVMGMSRGGGWIGCVVGGGMKRGRQ